MRTVYRLIPIFLLVLWMSPSAFAQGVLTRRTFGNLQVPVLGDPAATTPTSGLELEKLKRLSQEQQRQLDLLSGADWKNIQGRVPEALAGDSADMKNYVKRNIFRDTLIFGSELFSQTKVDFAPNLQLANAPKYVLGVGDELTITLYGRQEASYEASVLPNGTISVPYAGVLTAAGLELGAVQAALKQKLGSTGYTGLVNGTTKLSVAISQVRQIRVSVIGAKIPGSYTVPSVATALHLLYQSGGPAENGSFRQIEVIRNQEVVAKLDLYAFIATGILEGDIVLQEGDVVRIPVYEKRVNLLGEFKRRGIFELLADESLEDVMHFAGGFTEGAFKEQVLIFGLGQSELAIRDAASASFDSTVLNPGDVVMALPLRNRYTNRIAMTGGVVRPGYYPWESGITFQGLLAKAFGIDRQALDSRASILRRPDQDPPYYLDIDPISFDGEMFPNDSVYIGMRSDLRSYDSVAVRGNVMRPGRFAFYPGLTAEQALLFAGGIDGSGDLSEIEISNPILDEKGHQTGRSQIIRHVPNFKGEGLVLNPGAIVAIRKKPNLNSNEVVYFTGAVQSEGAYALSYSGEPLSGVFARVGGLKKDALPKFGLIIRTKSTQDLKDVGLYRRLEIPVRSDSVAYMQEFYEPVGRMSKDSIAINLSNWAQLNRIGLMDGDTVFIPKRLNTVMVRGEVKNPGGHAFVNGRRAKYYLNQAGGYRRGVGKRDLYVEYANGRSAEIKYALGMIPIYPRVYSNSTITVVPRPKKKEGLDAGQLAAYTSSLASISSITLGILYLLRP